MLRISKISFPGLGIGEFEVDSVAFSIGNIEIAWYALIITMGIIAAGLYTIWRANQVNVSTEDIVDFLLFVVPTGIIGARLYYVLTTLDRYDSFLEVINIRNGGLAIYGGILAGALAVFLVARYKKIPFLTIADCCTPGIILAQSIGRWGNFMNGEAYGYQTEAFIRMGLQNANTRYDFSTAEMVFVHPTFLYESLWNLVGFVLINLFYKHRKYDGQVFLMVFGWYGLGRLWIEGLRTDSLMIFGGTVRVSQLLACLIFIGAAVLLTCFAIKKYEKPIFIQPEKQKTKAKKK